MMYCVNEKYTIPLHTLITDLIEGQGGSATLIKMLNQLGLCASADTLARYIQHKGINKETAMNCCLNSDSFTVVSADNIDFLHSYARVYKGSKNSSWHGLSIQVDQPLPSLSMSQKLTIVSQKMSTYRPIVRMYIQTLLTGHLNMIQVLQIWMMQ